MDNPPIQLPAAIYTIGHSNLPIEEFLHILQAHVVARLVDVRTIPRSRHNPQFNHEILPVSLASVNIGYTHFPSLGGLRHASKDSINLGWRNASFRGFADYMQTEEFAIAVDELIVLARVEQIVIMCAEAVPWRCHRSLIADALIVRGMPVEHIYSAVKRLPHALTPFAVVTGIRITYPSPEEHPVD